MPHVHQAGQDGIHADQQTGMYVINVTYLTCITIVR